MYGVILLLFFFFKQKTAYEMRISDWSSDVCSSDLAGPLNEFDPATVRGGVVNPYLIVMMASPAKRDFGIERGAGFPRGQRSLLRRSPDVRILVHDEIGRASCRERVCQYV